MPLQPVGRLLARAARTAGLLAIVPAILAVQVATLPLTVAIPALPILIALAVGGIVP